MAKKQVVKKDEKKEPRAPLKAAEIPEIRPGDTVDVHVRIVEGDKERAQLFSGTIIQIRGASANRSFTVRKVSRGYGIERIFPFASPAIMRVEVKRHAKVRRAKLYYVRKLTGRETVLKERKLAGKPRPGTVEK